MRPEPGTKRSSSRRGPSATSTPFSSIRMAERSGWVRATATKQCYVGVSHDGAATFRWVAQGTQKCRTCGFVFFPGGRLVGDGCWSSSPIALFACSVKKRPLTRTMSFRVPRIYHRKLDANRALLGLAQHVAELWVANERGDACRWLSWSSSSSGPARPGARNPARPRR